ncbi:bifunctional diaminohydroxyphosphoribosylaminopyrimidine deaminase/5-amino-6-(5-phosphoribosylamino)uracil reductase RibD [Thiotrichales bacterium 19S9-12]|nr:bifunctional diaminohydroxyphosphoribosylaminopyrimidine deaminase/5-amino-6-(5-phosphoribosylamino)uracil reductase RibD [Thiotrichales bacterium 19S9-11]MCF6811323.1 bifunctional diaminohydroxyphosphoribosylaminopyrimidine deaminase/5-amino-6-(5-phosphoribosylamino)uracil reductase RibD [Thiotrichales bacterium 19S9-12]
MTISPLDEFFMQKAIDLASKGVFYTRPNPSVGCVIVKNNKIIGEGHHRKVGFAHAEVKALEDLRKKGYNAEGACVYVTLEPCSHDGRTPPCVNALIEANISRVVIASSDPNPQVNGIEILRSNGIEVVISCLEDKAEALNAGFFKAMKEGRPYVRLKLASSLDGRTAMASGESKWITSEASRLDVHKLRAKSGAIMTGINTVLVDNPALTVRIDSLDEKRFEQPLRVIVDRTLQIPLDAKVLLPNANVLIITESNDQKKIRQLQDEHVRVQTMVFDHQILSTILKLLHTDYEIRDLLVESGHKLSGSFLRSDLIDEFWYYMAPVIMGKSALPLFDVNYSLMSERYQLKLESVKVLDNDIKMIYRKGA